MDNSIIILKKNSEINKYKKIKNSTLNFNSIRITINKNSKLVFKNCNLMGNCIIDVYGHLKITNSNFFSHTKSKGLLIILHGNNEMMIENVSGYKNIDFFYPNANSSFINFSKEPQVVINLQIEASIAIKKSTIYDYPMLI